MRFSRLRYFFVLFAAALSSALLAQSSSPSVPPALLGTAPVELRHGVPFVRVLVNGQGPFLFGVDTGTSNQAIVSPALASALHMPTTRQIRLSDLAGVHSQTVDEVAVDSLRLANVAFHGVRAVVHPPLSAEGSYDGILGIQLFRGLLLTLDYPNRVLSLSRGALSTTEAGSVPMRLVNGIPAIQLTLGDEKVEAQIDSGGTGLCLPATVAHDLHFSGGLSTLGQGRSQVGRFALQGGEMKGHIALAGFDFKNPFIEICSTFPIANFGAAALADFALTIDQQHNLVRFQSAQARHTLRRVESPSLAELPAGVAYSHIAAVGGSGD